jgi:ADP-heptose:LPS heptosyltransferase
LTRILAYRFSAFGDVAMTVPVITEFLQQNPNLEIVMVSRTSFKDLFEGIPNLIFKGVNLDDHRGIFGLRQLGRILLTEYKPTYIADLHDVIRTKTLNLFFVNHGFKVYKINKGKEEKEHLTDIWNIEKKPLRTTTERYADVFRAMKFQVNLSHQYKTNSSISKNGIGIAPFAQHEGKMLRLDKMLEVVKILAQTHKIFFFGGGKNEVDLLNTWEKLTPNTENLAGKLTLKEELKRISELEVMISMDSANMHLASLMGTRCISIWGSTHPFAGFLGYGQSKNDVVQVKDLTCRPCSVFGDKECYRGDWACLEEIDIQSVIKLI